ncbi:SipW-dependent-type signal peptide-containing protein [[Eubacterium] hominis]|uniref:SipW-dependent-type signal peptide-containing protein n=1 Tax=[Eubacterium] hominis TaxID=2764325 RepID=UPI003A4E5351
MKNKRIATLLLSLGLVGAIGTGATLAYLSDTTDVLTNTFTFVEKGIDINLWETKVDSDTHIPSKTDKVVAGTNAGNSYNNVVANEVLTKNPTIDVTANSVDCYVFASIDAAKSNVEIVDLSKDWKVVSKEGNTTYYVYAKNGGDPTLVTKSDKDQTLTALFTKVKVSDVTELADLSADDIVIKASAVQAEKVDGALSYSTDVQKAGLALLK